MKALVTKLVDVILKRIQNQPKKVHTEKGIRSWLAGQGYRKRDIDAAMKLVAPRIVPAPRPHSLDAASARALSMHEDYKLSSEARNALARLDLYGLIDPYEREMILDRLNHFEGEVGIEELDYLITWVVCGGRDVESQQTIFNVMDGEGHGVH